MTTTTLRKVGGSVMLAIPPALLDVADFSVNMEVGLTVDDGKIIIQAAKARRYSLADLVRKCKPTARKGKREWVDAPVAGGELL